MSALHMAAQLGLIKVVKTLIALGADPLAVDWMKATPSDKAALGEHHQVEAFLHKVLLLERRSFTAFKQHVTYEQALAGIAGQVAAAAPPQPASSPAPFRLAT